MSGQVGGSSPQTGAHGVVANAVVPARRPDIARAALADMPGCDVVPMDLADLASVRAGAARIGDSLTRLDLFMAVAGVMATPERHVGPGWESQLAANHFGHFVLACELAPLLAAADGARVVVNSSAGHTLTDFRWHDPHFRTGYDRWLAYGQAKTANSLFAVRFDALGREHGVRAFALHPGKIITGLQREMTLPEQVERGWVDAYGNVIGADFKTPSQGAATGLWAATSPLLDGRGGVYLEDCDIARVAAPGTPMDDGGVRAYAVDPDGRTALGAVARRDRRHPRAPLNSGASRCVAQRQHVRRGERDGTVLVVRQLHEGM